ncbi:MAG: TetR/AcrR family transcriptional regulator [Bacteroidetes bacterium]|nr:TetR/AcrR family transcriptional regulator [Bacteroidota bacterium]
MRTKEGNKDKDILEAAVKVFAEYGYHKSKISKIAEVANVATGSVYVYFKNKEDILLRIFEELWEKLFHEYRKIARGKELQPANKFDKMIDMIFDLFTENPALAMVFVNEQNHLMLTNEDQFTKNYDKFLDEGIFVIKEGISDGTFSKDLDLAIFRHYIFGAIRNLLHNWAKEPRNFTLNNIRQNIKYLTMNGIKN